MRTDQARGVAGPSVCFELIADDIAGFGAELAVAGNGNGGEDRELGGGLDGRREAQGSGSDGVLQRAARVGMVRIAVVSVENPAAEHVGVVERAAFVADAVETGGAGGGVVVVIGVVRGTALPGETSE